MKDLIIMFLINLFATMIGVSIALWVDRRRQKQTSKQIKGLRDSIKYYTKKYGERKDET